MSVYDSRDVDARLRAQALNKMAAELERLATNLDRDERDRWTAWIAQGRALLTPQAQEGTPCEPGRESRPLSLVQRPPPLRAVVILHKPPRMYEQQSGSPLRPVCGRSTAQEFAAAQDVEPEGPEAA